MAISQVNNLSFLIDQLPGPYLILTPQFTIAAVSEPYLTATFTKRENIIGKDIFDVFPDNPADDNATGVLNLRASLNHVLQHLQPHAMADQKYDIRRPDGSFEERYWRPLNSPVFDARHQVIYIIHNVLDVTSSIKAKDQLKKSEHDFQLLVNNVKDYAIFLLDKNGCVASWNKGAENIKGYTAAEIIGKPMEIFYTSEDIRQGIPQKNLKTALQNERLETEGWRIRKDGSLFYANIVFTSLVDDKGNHYGYAKVTKDITEKRKDEERIRHLASITSNMQDPVITSDKDFNITRWNEAAEKLLGWKSEEVIGKTTAEVLNTVYPNQPREELLSIIDVNGIWQGELIYFAKSGRKVNVIATASKINDTAGNQTGNLIVIRDITDRKKAEEALSKLNEDLEFKVLERTEAIKHSEKQYRYLFENNPMPMWLMDVATFKFLDVNEMAKLHYGYSRREFLDMTALDIRPDAEKSRFLHSDHPAGITADNYNKGVWAHKKKNGDIIQVEICAQDIIFEGTAARIILANDVTEKKKAEEKLAASEKLFRALIENSNDLIVMLDGTFTVLYRSPSAARITGWQDDEITGFSSSKNIHPDDIEKATKLLKEVKANPGKPVYGKFRNKHKNGHYQWMEGVAINLLHDKNVKAIVFNSRDITERVEAEQKLIASEERFRNSLDNMLEGVQIIGFDWRYIYVNDTMAKHGKCAKEKLLGRTVMEIYPGIEQTEIFKVYQHCLNERVPIHLENEFEFPDKTKAWFELSFQPVPEGIFILSVDITERKNNELKIIESEENLKAIFENTAEGFILADTSGIIKEFNNKVLKSVLVNILGEIKVGQSLFDLVQPERNDFFKTIFAKIINGQTIQYSRCFTLPNGQLLWIEFRYTPVITNKKIKGICITGRDITTEKIAQQQKDFDRSNLNALINNTGDVMWSIDRNFNLITSNQAFNKQMEGLDGEVPQPGSNIFKNVTDATEHLQYEKIYNRAFTGETFTEVVYHKLPNDTWTEISFNPIYKDNDVIGTACFSRDITERKKAEVLLKKNFEEKKSLATRMSAILNTLPANIALLDKKGFIVDVNDSWRRFTIENDFNGANYGVGENYLIISKNGRGNGEQDGEKVAAGIKAVLENKTKEFVFEYQCHSPNEERWFRMIATPMNEKKHSGAVVMHIDISELRRLEQARLKSNIDEQKRITLAILQGQEKERNYIGKELHDNVNQILAGTKLFLSSAAHKNETVKELIKYPIELLNSSIEEIRLLCRNLVSPIKNIDLEELAKSLLKHCSENVQTTLNYAVPKCFLSDDLKLNIYRILQEMVNNTMKYAEAKNISISVQSEGKQICIIVADDGKGFDTKSKREGIGISNINNRVESFDGSIEIISSPGNGCQTVITIPVS